MKKFYWAIIFVMAYFFYTPKIQGQGCSDAGFCTSENFKPQNTSADSSDSPLKNTFKVSFSSGKADKNINVLAGAIEYSRSLTNKLGLNIKLTGISQSGKEHTSLGLSDVFLNGNLILNKNLNATIGIKFPLTNGNNTKAGNSLPMDYQTSLGTIDAIAGIAYNIKQLKLVFAIQQPLTQNNNSFLATSVDTSNSFYTFNSTKNYIRRADLLLRIAYSIKAGKKITITPSILPIYHVGNDEYTDMFNQKQIIKGSEGLTLNGNVFVEFKMNKKNAIELSIGAPFITRKSRPDGLTRKYVVGLEYRISF